MHQQQPISTQQAACLLHVKESQLADLVRRQLIDPAPVVIAGRRLWYPSQVQAAAELLLRRSRQRHDPASLEALLNELSASSGGSA